MFILITSILKSSALVLLVTLSAFSFKSHAIQKKYPVSDSMGASISFITGGNNLFRDHGKIGWRLFTMKGAYSVSLYLTKNDAIYLKDIALKAKNLFQEINDDGGCSDFEIHEKIGKISGIQQEYGTNTLSFFVDCKENITSVSMFYSDVHVVNTIYFTNRTWQEIEGTANEILDLYFLHSKNEKGDITYLLDPLMDWDLTWDFSKEYSPQCIAGSKAKQLNSALAFSMNITADSQLKVLFQSNNIQAYPISNVSLLVDEVAYPATSELINDSSRSFYFKHETLNTLSHIINNNKPYYLEFSLGKNKVKRYELIEPSGTNTIGHTFAANPYCNALKKNKGIFGFMFIDALQNEALNTYIASISDFSKAGVVIMSVNPRKKAHKAGLRLFDVVLGVDGVPVDMQKLIQLMQTKIEGTQLNLHILRNNELVNLSI